MPIAYAYLVSRLTNYDNNYYKKMQHTAVIKVINSKKSGFHYMRV